MRKILTVRRKLLCTHLINRNQIYYVHAHCKIGFCFLTKVVKYSTFQIVW